MLRNEQIQSAIDQGEIPILPFERKRAEQSFSQLVGRQAELGQLMRNAMTQSSETWHDNAPADVIRNESQITASIAETAIKVLQHGREFGYEISDDTISLGSIVNIRYDNTGKIVSIFLTGVTRDIKSFISDDNINGVTITSPVGKAILGLSTGDSTEIIVGEKILPISIISVRQTDVSAENYLHARVEDN